jgi:SAM-dependent methyltransferase
VLKRLYHAAFPDAVRYPIGRLRRGLHDRFIRLMTPGPLPPRHLLRAVQMTPYVKEFLDVGAKAAAAIAAALAEQEIRSDSAVDVLDFGCGLSRTLRFMPRGHWRLHGCDVDGETIAWSRSAFADVAYQVNAAQPPLPFPEGHFAAAFAVSVFTHFDFADQRLWAAEMARILPPGGILVVTTMGPHALTGFPNLFLPENRDRLATEGFFLAPGGEKFNERGAFHNAAGLVRCFAPHFELLDWRSGGLDGFQDLSILRRIDSQARPA